jgi:hypothetical protein
MQRPVPKVAEVLAFIAKHKLSLADLIEVGGESLSSRDVEKARRVANSWALMARLNVKFADLEQALPNTPTRPSRGRRGEGHFSESIENKEDFATDTPKAKCLKNNDKTDNHPVGVSGRWGHKRRLAPIGAES